MSEINILRHSVFYIWFSFSSLVFAADVTVVTEDWAPFNYLENGEVVGLSTAIVKATLDRAKVSYDLNLAPWPRAYNQAQKDPNTLIYTIARTEEREDLFHWIGPFASRRIYLFKLKSREDIQVNTFEDLKKYRIALFLEDATHQQLIKLGHPKDKIELVSAINSNVLMLKKGRVDLIPANEFALATQLAALNPQDRFAYSELEKSWLLFDTGGYYMAFSRQTPQDMVRKVQDAFEAIKKEGVVQTIVEEFLGAESTDIE